MSEHTTELENCPFCNGAARMATEYDEDGIAWHYIKCCKCSARSRGKWHSAGNDCPQLYAEVRDEWNRRSYATALCQQTEPVAAGHQQLMKFYAVDSLAALVNAQAHHIEKLQAKLPPTPSLAPQPVREG